MTTTVVDVEKVLKKIQLDGKYLLVDFSKHPADFYFGKEVSPRDSLQLQRHKREYRNHLRRSGSKPHSTRSTAAADARKQIDAIRNYKDSTSDAEKKALLEKKAVAESIRQMTMDELKSFIEERKLDIKTTPKTKRVNLANKVVDSLLMDKSSKPIQKKAKPKKKEETASKKSRPARRTKPATGEKSKKNNIGENTNARTKKQ